MEEIFDGISKGIFEEIFKEIFEEMLKEMFKEIFDEDGNISTALIDKVHQIFVVGNILWNI